MLVPPADLVLSMPSLNTKFLERGDIWFGAKHLQVKRRVCKRRILDVLKKGLLHKGVIHDSVMPYNSYVLQYHSDEFLRGTSVSVRIPLETRKEVALSETFTQFYRGIITSRIHKVCHPFPRVVQYLHTLLNILNC